MTVGGTSGALATAISRNALPFAQKLHAMAQVPGREEVNDKSSSACADEPPAPFSQILGLSLIARSRFPAESYHDIDPNDLISFGRLDVANKL